MEFRVLGSLQVSAAGQPVVVNTAPKRRLTLAVLLARAGQPVPVDTLVEAVWGHRPPASARRNIQLYVHGFRQIFGADLVATLGDGYLLGAGAKLDSVEFRRLAADGAATQDAGEPSAAEPGLRAALDLWRGPAFTEFLDCELVAYEATRLESLRLETLERWAEAQLTTGATPRLVAELTDMSRLHPYREGLCALLMRALYQTGRQVEALAVFRGTRALLVDEIGVEPGLPLQRLHEAMLRGDETLATPPQHEGARLITSPAPPPPRQLPTPPQLFTGREPELAVLSRLRNASTVVVNAIDGMAGVGKTALATYAAHRLADHYPDGQLFIDLHGYTQGLQPVEPAAALELMLRALGIPGTQIPAGLDERAGLYRTVLAGKQTLVVLDNAATEEQVSPLLPGAAGCLVLVTSRRRLAGLDHTTSLSLDTMPTADAIALFAQTVGERQLAGQPPELLEELVALCGRLPLAIRIAAARLRCHPTWNLTHLARRLRDQQHRLTELQAGQRSVTGALDLSYQHLNSDQQRAYRLLGLHPGPDLDAYATAALLDCDLRAATAVLDQLLEAHLLQEPIPDRYQFHDLTRAHAAHTPAPADRLEPVEQGPLERLLNHYRRTAAEAIETAYPYEREHLPKVQPARTPAPDLADPVSALSWLDTETPNLLAAGRSATDRGRSEHLLHLSAALHRHLRARGRYRDAENLHQQALTAARATGDPAAQLNALTHLGWAQLLQGRYPQATDHLEQALKLAHASGRRPDEPNAHNGLGLIHRLQGRYWQAADHHQQALQLARTIGVAAAELNALNGLGGVHRIQSRLALAADYYQQGLQIARAIGHPFGELDALSGLGHIHRAQGQYAPATHYFEQALQIARSNGHPFGELNALNSLGRIHVRQRRYVQAICHFEQALQIARTTGDPVGEMTALTSLGEVDLRQERYEQAGTRYRQLVGLAKDTGDRNFEYEAWQGMGRVLHGTHRSQAAITHHEQALALASELGIPDDQARAHDGLAHAHHALNQHRQARKNWQHALNILSRLGIDHTDDEETNTAAIRAHLDTLPDRTAAGRDT